MQRSCAASGQLFEIPEEDLAFYRQAGPQIGDCHFALSPPKCCPQERRRRRIAFRNQPIFYRARSAVSQEPLLTVYSPQTGYKLCTRGEYLALDNTESGRVFDFSRPFFDQFAELQQSTIKAATMSSGEIANSDYADFIGWAKNCYLAFDSGTLQDCLYCTMVGYARDCIDCYELAYGELCYNCVKVEHGYHLIAAVRCENCSFSAFLYDCIGCSHCIGCCDLRNKQYWVFNEHVGEARYRELWQEIFCGSWSRLETFSEKFRHFYYSRPHRALHLVDAHECTGDMLSRCENLYECYNCYEVKNSRYLDECYFGVDRCYDVYSWGEDMEFCAELVGSGGIKGKVGMAHCYYSGYVYYGGYEVLYSLRCTEKCRYLFGCCDLRNKKYCVLNRQLSKDEYETLVPRIIEQMQHTGEWGEFFPMEISPFGYNKSYAMEEYPATQAEVAKLHGWWDDYVPPQPTLSETHPATALPDRLDATDQAILAQALVCERSGTAFRLAQAELDFYRKMGLPLPRCCFYERHLDRKRRLNPRRLWPRTCALTGREILTTYAPTQREIVVCEEAYQEKVVR